MADDDFHLWLEQVGERYRSLSSLQCNETLDHLISISQGSQLYHLSELLNGLLRRDFIAALPREISFRIVRQLSAKTLLICGEVSRTWAYVIDSCTEAWRGVCINAGLNTNEDIHDAMYWKQKYIRCSRRLKTLENGQAFRQKLLFGHMDRVMAVYYNNGLLATGSDDHTVRIWDCCSGQCLRIIQTHTVAELKFDQDHIFTASFDTTAACWDFHTGELCNRYSGHVAAVFSVDYSNQLDLVITGSADSTVKIWVLSSGQLIHTMPHHRSNWIMQVCLVDCGATYRILSRDSVSIHVWRVKKAGHVIAGTEEWQKTHNDLVPGFQVTNDRVSFSGVDTDNIYYVVENDLSRPDGGSLQRVSHKLHRDTFAQAFLGCGSRYDVVLTQGDIATVNIIRHSDNTIVSSARLPSDYRQSKRMSTFTLGERGWLDGFDGCNDDGAFFVTSLRDNSILLLQWSSLSDLVTSESA